MSDSIRVENETERLVALQALETYRALQQAVKTAPHGKGLETVEAVVHERGFAHLQQMYEAALREHPGAQKRGLFLELPLRAEVVVPLRDAQTPAEHRRHDDRRASLLRVPALRPQADPL